MNKQTPPGGIEWRDIPGYEGLYVASSIGDIIRIAGSPRCRKNRKLKPSANNKSGYWKVSLSKLSDVRQFDIHKLITLAFLGDSAGKWVNHKNGCKTDNRIENLEYVTPSENLFHAYRIGLQPSRRGEGNGQAVLTNEDIVRIRELAESGVPRREIVDIIGASKTAVRDVIVGKSWTHIK